jgi:hypothetical protein
MIFLMSQRGNSPKCIGTRAVLSVSELRHVTALLPGHVEASSFKCRYNLLCLKPRTYYAMIGVPTVTQIETDRWPSFASGMGCEIRRGFPRAAPVTPLGKVFSVKRISSQKFKTSRHLQRINPAHQRLSVLAIQCYGCL